MDLLPSIQPKYRGERQIQSALCGDNCNQLTQILELYALPNQTIYDVTWGLGAMWKDIDLFKYNVVASDLRRIEESLRPGMSFATQDFRILGYPDRRGDVLILDPPYMGGKQTHTALAEAYNNQNDDHEAVMRLYNGGLLEAWRVLRFGGRVFVKCQDELSGGKQRWTHVEIIQMLQTIGFDVVDLFVLVNESRKLMNRHEHQSCARKNHSYWIIGRKPFARPSKRKDGPKKTPKRIIFDNEKNG